MIIITVSVMYPFNGEISPLILHHPIAYSSLQLLRQDTILVCFHHVSLYLYNGRLRVPSLLQLP